MTFHHLSYANQHDNFSSSYVTHLTELQFTLHNFNSAYTAIPTHLKFQLILQQPHHLSQGNNNEKIFKKHTTQNTQTQKNSFEMFIFDSL